jgi:hypothetical protein
MSTIAVNPIAVATNKFQWLGLGFSGLIITAQRITRP